MTAPPPPPPPARRLPLSSSPSLPPPPSSGGRAPPSSSFSRVAPSPPPPPPPPVSSLPRPTTCPTHTPVSSSAISSTTASSATCGMIVNVQYQSTIRDGSKSDEFFPLHVCIEAKISDLKRLILVAMRMADDEIVRLVFAGKSLQDHMTLREYSITHNSRVHAILCHYAGMAYRVSPLPFDIPVPYHVSLSPSPSAAVAPSATLPAPMERGVNDAIIGSPATRILKELKQSIQQSHTSTHTHGIQQDEKECVNIVPVWPLVREPGLVYQYYQIALKGPLGSPYEGGIYYLWWRFPHGYPFKLPHVHFATPILHPNIDGNNGTIYGIRELDDNWSPAFTMVNVVQRIMALLTKPIMDPRVLAPSWTFHHAVTLPLNVTIADSTSSPSTSSSSSSSSMPTSSSPASSLAPPSIPLAVPLPSRAVLMVGTVSGSDMVAHVENERKLAKQPFGNMPLWIIDRIRGHTAMYASPHHHLSLSSIVSCPSPLPLPLPSSEGPSSSSPTMSAREYFLLLPAYHRSVIRTILAISSHHHGVPLYSNNMSSGQICHWHKLSRAIILMICDWLLPAKTPSPLELCMAHAPSSPSK